MNMPASGGIGKPMQGWLEVGHESEGLSWDQTNGTGL